MSFCFILFRHHGALSAGVQIYKWKYIFSFLVTSYLSNNIHKHTSSPPINASTSRSSPPPHRTKPSQKHKASSSPLHPTPWNPPKDPKSLPPLPVPHHTNTTCSASPTQFGPSPSPSRALLALSNCSLVYTSTRFS